MKSLSAFLLFLIIVVVAAAYGQAPMMVLDGIVSSRQQWGPPGFGETPAVDQKVRIFVLKLHRSKSAKELSLPSTEKLGRRFGEIQLSCDTSAFPSCRRLLEGSVGHRVTVSGELARAVNPTDYLPIGMTVRLIQRP